MQMSKNVPASVFPNTHAPIRRQQLVTLGIHNSADEQLQEPRFTEAVYKVVKRS